MSLLATLKGPPIDSGGLSPLVALIGGATLILLVGLVRGRLARERIVPALTLATLAATLGLTIAEWHARKSIVAGALRVDDLALLLTLVFITAAIAAVLLSLGDAAAEQAGHGEYHALLLSCTAGMVVLVEAQNLVSLFIGLELLSISLYVLCATDLRRSTSLESGLKYLIIGSVGSATLLYGLAMTYGATGSTDFAAISHALENGVAKDPLLLTGVALIVTGLAFKASTAPFHQWTPDVYEGAPTPITAFMAVATKAAAFGIFLRLFDVALINAAVDWAPVLAVLAATTIVVGNVGALTQSSLKRMLAWSGVAQAGYLLAGVLVSSRVGVEATAYYLAVYAAMNLAAFAVVAARERETGAGDDIGALSGLGASRPALAWPMTIAMLSLAGIPATAGFVGKFYLIDAAVQGGYTWVGVMIVVGSMISLAYYLRVVATMWLTPDAETDRAESSSGPARPGHPAMAGGAPEADAGRDLPATGLALLFGAASLFFGIIPSPLLDLAKDAGGALGLL